MHHTQKGVLSVPGDFRMFYTLFHAVATELAVSSIKNDFKSSPMHI